MMRAHAKEKLPEAWVVFTGQTDLPWLKMLKPGFRHCYVLLNDGDRWVSLDPLSNYLDVSIHHHVPAKFNLPLWLKSRGLIVVRAPMRRARKEAPWMLFTCTEAVKRVLGLHKRSIITPWQLYRYLQDEEMRGSGDEENASLHPVISSSHHPSHKGEPAWEA